MLGGNRSPTLSRLVNVISNTCWFEPFVASNPTDVTLSASPSGRPDTVKSGLSSRKPVPSVTCRSLSIESCVIVYRKTATGAGSPRMTG